MNTTLPILLALVCCAPADRPLVADHVLIIERNHVYGSPPATAPYLRQYLYRSAHGIIDWRYEHQADPPTHEGTLWRQSWFEYSSRLGRWEFFSITADIYRQTETEHDPEVIARARVPEHDRIKLGYRRRK